MPDVVTIDLSKMRRLKKVMREIGSVTDDLSPYFEAVVPVLRERIEDTFTDEGPGWTPLTANTVAARLRAGFGSGPILFRTGALMRSATSEAQVDISSRELLYRTTLPYAASHQRGTRRIPARPFIRKEQLLPVVVAEFGRVFRERVGHQLKAAL